MRDLEQINAPIIDAIQSFYSRYRSGQTESAEVDWQSIESRVGEYPFPPAQITELLVTIQIGRAKFHLDHREFFAAEPLLTRCLDDYRTIATSVDATDQQIATLVKLFTLQTDLYLAQRTPLLAENPAREALRFAERIAARSTGLDGALPEAHAACQLAHVYRRLGKQQMAKDLYVRALRVYRRHADDLQRKSVLYDTLTNLATLDLEMGDSEHAEILLREVHDKLTQLHGEDNPLCASAISHIAFVERSNGQVRYVQTYDRVTNLLEKTTGNRFHEYLSHLERRMLAKRFVGEEIAAQIDLTLVEEIRSRRPLKHPLSGQNDVPPIVEADAILDTFAAGDYVGTVRETEKFVGTRTTLEFARIRLIALLRLQQYEQGKELSNRLLANTSDLPFDQALIKVLLGQISRDDVLRMASDVNEFSQALYYAAARLRTEKGFDTAQQSFTECVESGGSSIEAALAKRELEAADAAHSPITVPAWEAGELVEATYRVRALNTDGAMSLVYFVRHEKWNVELALKVPRPQVISSPEAWHRLRAEANLWVNLGVHPNIVTAYYVRRISNIPVIVMEKVDGGSLKDALKAGKVTELGAILDVAIQVARGLAYASEKIPGFVHRDVKPANVLLTNDGTAKVTDFGLSNAVGMVAGSPAYMAPEVWVHPDKVGPPADIYSFGAMLFEMLTGRRPFVGAVGEQFARVPDSMKRESNGLAVANPVAPVDPNLKTELWPGEATQDMPPEHDSLTELMLAHLHQPPPEPRTLRSDVSEDISSFCLRLLAKDPSERPSASEAVVELMSLYEVVTGQKYLRLIPDASALLADSLNNQALSMLDLGRDEEATRLWKEAIDLNALDAETVFNTALRAWRNGDITDSEVLERLDDLAGTQIDAPSLSYLKALVHLECDNLSAVLAELERVDESLIASRSIIEDLRSRARERNKNARAQVVTIDGHNGPITAVCVNHDGSRAITSGRDQTLKSWCIGAEVTSAPVCRHPAAVTGVDVSEDWSSAASIDIDGILRLWRLDSGACTQSIESGHRQFGFVAISPDGRICFTSNSVLGDRSHLWEAGTGRCIATLKSGAGSAFVSSERDLLITTDLNSMKFWRLSTGEGHHVQHISHCSLPTRPIALDRADRLFVMTKENVDIVIAETGTGRILRTFSGHKDAVLHLACPSELSRFVSSGADGTVRLWDVQTGRCVRTIDAGPHRITALDMSSDGRRIMVGTEAGQALIFDWPQLPFTAPFILSHPVDSKTLQEISQIVRTAVSNFQAEFDDGNFIEAARIIRNARDFPQCRRHPDLLTAWFELYPQLAKKSLQSVWKRCSWACHSTFVQSVRVSESGNHMLSVGRDGIIQMQDSSSGECLHRRLASVSVDARPERDPKPDRRVKAEMIWAGDLSRDGRQAIVAGGDGRLSLFDASSGDCVQTIVVGDEQLLAVRFTRNPDRIVSGSSDGIVTVHEVISGKRIHQLQGHSDAVTALAISADDRLLATTGEDQTIRIWDLESGACLQTFGANDSGPLVTADVYNKQAAAPDLGVRALIKNLAEYTRLPIRLRARRALAICLDQCGSIVLRAIGSRLEIWNVATSTLIRSIEAHNGLILDADMTPEGRFAVSAGTDRYLRVWDLASGHCLQSVHTSQEPWSVSVSPDFRQLLSGEFGSVTEWNLDWELTEQVSATMSMPPAPPLDMPQNELEYLTALCDELISSQNERLEECASRICLLSWEQLRGAREMLTHRIPLLIERLRFPENGAASQAALNLLVMTGTAAVAPLRLCLHDATPRFRQIVVHALGGMGAAAERTIPDLVRALGDPIREVGLAAAHALFSIGPKAIPELCRELRNQDCHVSRLCLYTLSHFGPMARAAVPAIEQSAADTNDHVFRETARKVLRRIQNPEDDETLDIHPVARGRRLRRLGVRLIAVSIFAILIWLVIAMAVGPTSPNRNAWAYYLGGWLMVGAILSFIVGLIAYRVGKK